KEEVRALCSGLLKPALQASTHFLWWPYSGSSCGSVSGPNSVVPSFRYNLGISGELSLILVEIMPFSPIIKTPLALFCPPMSWSAGIMSGCAGRIPPSLQVILIGDLLFSVAAKLMVVKEATGHPSGL